jgi:hypothetical protein
MKKSLATIGSTLTIFIAFALLLEIAFQDYKTRVDTLFDQIRAVTDRIDVVLLGNSHIQGLAETSFSGKARVLDLADGGKDIFHDLLLLKDLVSRALPPRIGIMGTDYEAVAFDFDVSHQRFLDRQYYTHTGVLYDNSLSNRIMAMSHFLRSGRDFRRSDRSAQTPPPEHPLLTDATCRKKALEKTKMFFDEKLIPSNVALLRQLASTAMTHGVRMVFITTPKKPCFYTYADTENTRLSRNELHAFMHSPEAGDAVYLDYYEDLRFSDADFRDYTHLNTPGRLKMEKILAADLRSRGLLAP